jgi:hypothetical protein
MDYIPLPCILTDPVLKALLSYVETAVVLLLLMGAWLVVRCWREAWAEYYLSVLFSLLFTVGLRASTALFMRYDEDQTRLTIARLVATLLWLFWLYLLLRFHGLLRKARVTALCVWRRLPMPWLGCSCAPCKTMCPKTACAAPARGARWASMPSSTA